MNFSSLIYQISKRLSNKTALIEDGVQISYQELWSKIEKISESFLTIGLKPDTKAVILLPNCKEFIYIFFALLKAKIIAIPLNPKLTIFELEKIFKTVAPQAVISNSSLIQKLKDNAASLLENKIIITSDASSELYKIKPEKPVPKFTTNNNQVASINFTYRGYGYPLGVVLTHGNYIHGAAGYIRLVEPALDQRFLLIMPIFHIFTLIGCVVVPLLRGATVVIMKNVIPKHIFKVIEEYKIDFLVSIPTLYKVLLENYDASKYNLSSLKYGISGADFMERQLYDNIKERMRFEILQGYGLTETLPVVCNPKSGIKPESLGVPGHEVKVKIVDENGNEKKTGEVGEILIGGPTVMKGYYNLKKETNGILKDGWVYTGDLGRLDEDGYLYFAGLKKDIIKTGGNTVDLNEVKNILLSHPDILGAEVYARPDRLWGKIVEARVYTSSNGLSEKEIKNYCSQRLALFKLPRRIKITAK